MDINFQTVRGTFSQDSSTLNTSVTTTFGTDITKLTAAVQSWKIRTGSDREIRDFALLIDNIQINGTNASCTISFILNPTWTLESNSCYVDIVFTAVCE